MEKISLEIKRGSFYKYIFLKVTTAWSWILIIFHFL